ncbi:hypothetical protein [Streptomyces sp. NPDC126514]|uniref:hypothetical protein n=1 Tax=Streptomyces sp. NPDC126514 TaxID=3155210 RepID=UPI00332BDE53
MEIEQTKPVKPIKPGAPAEIIVNGKAWILDSQEIDTLAVYKNDGENFHVTVVVETGWSHTSPEGGPLHGTSLHVYEHYVDNHAQDQDTAVIWLYQRDEMQDVCRQFRKKWPTAKKKMLSSYRKEKAQYNAQLESYEAWRREHHPTSQETKDRKIQATRKEVEAIRATEKKLRSKTPIDILDLSNGVWLVKLGENNERTMPAKFWHLARTKELLWTDDARRIGAHDGSVLGSLDGRLYICSERSLRRSKEINVREQWIANLPLATLDPDGFLRYSEGSYKAPSSILPKIGKITIETGQEGCFRARINGVAVVVWPEHPDLRLPSEDAWLAWATSLPRATIQGSTVAVETEAGLVHYLAIGSLPDEEPTMNSEGCCLIVNGHRLTVLNYQDTRYFKEVDEQNLRSEWIETIPKGQLHHLKNGVYEIVAGDNKYRLCVSSGNLVLTLEVISANTTAGTRGCFTVKHNHITYALDPNLGDGLLVSLAAWKDITKKLPVGYVRSKAGDTTISVALGNGTEQSYILKGDLPPSYPCCLVEGSFYLASEEIIVNPAAQSASFTLSNRVWPKDRKTWIGRLPWGEYESPESITINGVKYRIPEGRRGDELTRASTNIPVGTRNCYLLNAPGGKFVGPVVVGDASFPLVSCAEWDQWRESLETAHYLFYADTVFVIPHATDGLIYTITPPYREPTIGTPGCFSFLAQGKHFVLDPAASNVKAYANPACILIARLEGDKYLVSDTGHCTWEACYISSVGAIPDSDTPILLLEDKGGARSWSELFVTKVEAVNYQSWYDSLEKREDTVLLPAPPLEPSRFVQIETEEFEVAWDTSNPLDCFTNVWFLARYGDEWVPVRFLNLSQNQTRQLY